MRRTRCSTPVDLVDQQYFSDALQTYPTVNTHTLQLKEEATFINPLSRLNHRLSHIR
jgi:hypothetical protein